MQTSGISNNHPRSILPDLGHSASGKATGSGNAKAGNAPITVPTEVIQDAPPASNSSVIVKIQLPGAGGAAAQNDGLVYSSKGRLAQPPAWGARDNGHAQAFGLERDKFDFADEAASAMGDFMSPQRREADEPIRLPVAAAPAESAFVSQAASAMRRFSDEGAPNGKPFNQPVNEDMAPGQRLHGLQRLSARLNFFA